MPSTRAMRQREEALNAKLGELLSARYTSWDERSVRSEGLGEIRDSGARIDVLVVNPNGRPVAVEAKFDSANVDAALRKQVESRIGTVVDDPGLEIEAGLSVVYPTGMTASALPEATLRYAAHQLGEDDRIRRWPEGDRDWIEGSVGDLADAIEIVSLSEKRIRRGERVLSDGIRDASSRLERHRARSAFGANMARVLHQEQGEQTTRMAVAIIVNAFVFHYTIEDHDGIPNVDEGSRRNGFRKMDVTKTWSAVLDVNYWPIFSIAKEVLSSIPTKHANPLLDAANDIAVELVKVGATTFHDMAARMFQTLIADRKFLATFYTLPESACLLAELVVSQLDINWKDESALQSLRIADFACGTGTLLSATQGVIYRRLRRAGFIDADFHRTFMEKVLLGTDIMPSAAHLTASMLSSAHPVVGYDDSLVRVLPYGIDEELPNTDEITGLEARTAYIGALDLRKNEFAYGLFTAAGIGSQVEIGGKQMTGKAKSAETGRDFPVEHESFDIVIMNPPFTRPTNHRSTTVPVPSFAGFDTSAKEQAAMSKSLRSHRGDIFGHGNAGLASNFMDVAHTKLRPGGVLGLVLPFSFVSGQSWESARHSLAEHYSDIHIVSIAAGGDTDGAFSADTGMAECLVIAKKNGDGAIGSKSVKYANLSRRPRMLLEAHEFARRIRSDGGIEGTMADTGVAGIRDRDVAHALMALEKGILALPREAKSFPVPIAPLNVSAVRGLLHRDISGEIPRGAFDIEKWDRKGTPTYPALWTHRAGAGDGHTERRFVVQPDTCGIARSGLEREAAETWNRTASRLHHNLDFRLNSQSLAVCMTPGLSLGGRAWPNIIPHQERLETPLVLWGNSTLGLMLFWWQASRQQQGRAILTISRIPELVTIDATALSDRQLNECRDIYARFCDRVFLPANEAYRDDTRKALDAEIFEVLGLPESLLESLDLLRLKWSCEPSVHGGKNTRPEV